MRDYFSPTQIEAYTKCGEAWRRRYIEREIIPPGFALIKGTSLHSGAEENFKQKMETRADLPESDIKDIAATAFEQKIAKEGFALDDYEKSVGADKIRGLEKDSVVRMAGEFSKSVAPKYQPVGVEETVKLRLPGTTKDILGKIDLVLEDGFQDTKTSYKKKQQTDVDTSVQFTAYAALFKQKFGKEAIVRIDNVIDRVTDGGKVVTEAQALVTQRTARDVAALVARINAIDAGVKAGTFIPAMPGSWWCSPKWCGYWSTCKYVNSERKAAANE